jgi:hypothetical protein
MNRDMRNGIFFYEDQEWAFQRVRDVFEMNRRARTTQQWLRYVSHWPIALKALRRLWEMGTVSEMKSPFWEPSQKRSNQ